MARAWRLLTAPLCKFWHGVRQWCGDADYERYVCSLRTRDTDNRGVVTRERFYLEQLNRRYSRPNRCC